ncbi:MAG: DUF2179 domain-containing protein [Porphyromonadaceae bacterium]|nr:DUF2179 domain-containing protein [Porphyromonadaceae bacterium]
MFSFLDQYPYLLPFFIFLGRIFDVTLGTLRIIFVSKGKRGIAPVIGFFEVFIWIVIISQILARANDLIAYLSYAGGYATGTYVGMLIESKLAFGVLLYRVYTQENGSTLVKKLNENGFGATLVHGEGSIGKVDVIEIVLDRNQIKNVENVINSFDKDAFYVTEDVRNTQNGIFPKTASIFKRWRPGK